MKQEFQQGTIGANVLVAFDPSAINFLFKKSSNFGDFTKYVEGHPEAYLFGYQSPRNILQFEHSYGYRDGGAGGGAPTFIIKLIDPEVEFENRFIKNASMEGMAMEAFSVNLDDLKTVEDFKSLADETGNPIYSDWYDEVFEENMQEEIGRFAASTGQGSPGFYGIKKKDTAPVVRNIQKSWAPDFAGRSHWPRLWYNDGDKIGEPTGGMGNYNTGGFTGHYTYQIKLSTPEEDAAGNTRFDAPNNGSHTKSNAIWAETYDDIPKDVDGNAIMPQAYWHVEEDIVTQENHPNAIMEGLDYGAAAVALGGAAWQGDLLVENVEKDTVEDMREKIRERQKKLTVGAVTKLHIAYGMGTDFSTWAGPFSASLMDATNEYDAKGVRTLSLTLVAATGALGAGQREGAFGAGFNRKVRIAEELSIKDMNKFGQGNLQVANSDEVKAVVNKYKKIYGKDFAEDWIEEHKGVTNKNFGKDPEKHKPYLMVTDHIPGDIHLIIRSLVTKYVAATASQGTIPHGNIITLFPNLDDALEEIQKAVLADVLQSNDVRAAVEGKYWNSYGNAWKYRPVAGANVHGDSSDELRDASYVKSHITPVLDHDGDGDSDITMQTVWGYQTLRKLAEVLGIDFVVSPREGEFSKWAGADEYRVRRANRNLTISAYKEENPYDSDEDDTVTFWSDALMALFGKAKNQDKNKGKSRMKFEFVIRNKREEDFEETLYRFLNTLEANSGISLQPTMIWEQDENILKMLAEHGVIATDQHPAILVGSKHYIDTLVYGHLAFLDVFKEKTAISDLLKYLHVSDVHRFSVMAGSNAVLASKDHISKSSFFPYCQAVFNYMYDTGHGAFNRLFLPVESYAKDKEEENILQTLAAAGVPILKSGKPNSNIISMKMDLKPYYLAGLSFNFVAEQGRAARAGTGVIPDPTTIKGAHPDTIDRKDGGKLTAEQIDTIIAAAAGGAESVNQKTLDSISNLTKEHFGFSVGSPEDYKSFLQFLMGITNAKVHKEIEQVIPAAGGLSAFESVKRMVDFISQQTIKGAVRTLPYFKLSGLQSLARPIIMDVTEARAIGVRGNTSAFTTAIYSGFWNMFGFKHVITNKEAFSEFTIIKQPGMSPNAYKTVQTELTDKQEKALLQATLESGDTYSTEDVLVATQQSGAVVNNLLEIVQTLNQPDQEEGGFTGE